MLCPDPQPPERPPGPETWMQEQGLLQSECNRSRARNLSSTLNTVRAGGLPFWVFRGKTNFHLIYMRRPNWEQQTVTKGQEIQREECHRANEVRVRVGLKTVQS